MSLNYVFAFLRGEKKYFPSQVESDSIYLEKADSNWIKKLHFIRVLNHLGLESIGFNSCYYFSTKKNNVTNNFYNSGKGSKTTPLFHYMIILVCLICIDWAVAICDTVALSENQDTFGAL